MGSKLGPNRINLKTLNVVPTAAMLDENELPKDKKDLPKEIIYRKTNPKIIIMRKELFFLT